MSNKKKIFWIILIIIVLIVLFFVFKSFQKRVIPVASQDEQAKQADKPIVPEIVVSKDSGYQPVNPVYDPVKNVLYVYFSKEDDNNCGVVESVRRARKTDDVYKESLGYLFRGPMSFEIEKGINSVFNSGTSGILKYVKVENQIAYVNLVDIRQQLSGVSSSCGSQQFMTQIDQTLMQYPEIDKVIYAIEGNPEIFYEWVQLGCSEDNNDCDPVPFEN